MSAAGCTLERLWPDADRRDAALTSILVHIYTMEDEQVTPFQQRCLQGIAAGLTMPETAVMLNVPTWKVTDNLRIARRSLQAKTLAHAVANALRQEIIT